MKHEIKVLNKLSLALFLSVSMAACGGGDNGNNNGGGSPADTDGDGVIDTIDAFPNNANESVDTDNDGIGNNADTDDDGDGVADSIDAFPLNATESIDTDGDGIGNNADTDDDGDGASDASEIAAGTDPLNSSDTPDINTPTANNFMPANNSIGISTTTNISAQFNEDMLATTVTNSNFTLKNVLNTVLSASVNLNANNKVTLNPDTDLALLSTYIATLSTGITDLAGNALSQTSWQFTTRDGAWEEPINIETSSGSAFSPQVAFDHNGNALAIWTQDDGTRRSIWSNRYTPATGWGSAQRIEADDIHHAGTNAQVAIDDNGNALAIWGQNGGMNSVWSNRYTPSTGWGTAELIGTNDAGDPDNFQIAFDRNGNALAVWEHDDDDQINIWSNRYSNSVGWQTAEKIETDNTGDAEGPQIAIDNEGNALAVWGQYVTPRTSIWANRYTKEAGWGTPVLIEANDNDQAYSPQIAMDNNNNALVVWVHANNSNQTVWANRYNVGSGWGTAEVIQSDFNSPSRDPRIAIDNNGMALAVWRQGEFSNGKIWSNRYTTESGWETAQVFDAGPYNSARPEIAFDTSGNALAVWEKNDDNFEITTSNRFSHLSGWETPQSINIESRNVIYGTKIAIDKKGQAIIVWRQNDGTRTNIKVNHFR